MALWSHGIRMEDVVSVEDVKAININTSDILGGFTESNGNYRLLLLGKDDIQDILKNMKRCHDFVSSRWI